MGNVLCLSPAPHGGMQAHRSDFDELSESSHTGRETPGNAFSTQTPLGCHITHHSAASKGAGIWAMLRILGDRLCPRVLGTARLPGD